MGGKFLHRDLHGLFAGSALLASPKELTAKGCAGGKGNRLIGTSEQRVFAWKKCIPAYIKGHPGNSTEPEKYFFSPGNAPWRDGSL